MKLMGEAGCESARVRSIEKERERERERSFIEGYFVRDREKRRALAREEGMGLVRER